MSEKKQVVDNLRLSYEGLFSVSDLYMLIDQFFREKGFDKREIRNQEHVKAGSRYIDLVLMPWKKITDYANHVVRVEIVMRNVKDVEVEKDGHKIKLNKGRVAMRLDAFLETDYEHRWEQRPIYFFIRTLFDKFVYSTYTERFEAQLIETTKQLNSEVKAFLNLHRY